MGTADKDYFLDGDGKVTTDQDAAATLLIRKGQDIPADMAEQYGIGKSSKAKATAEGTVPETDAATATDSTEKASRAKSNKAAKPASNK